MTSPYSFAGGSSGGGGGGTAPDADATTKGLVQLAGDLAGTATAPTVPALAGKAPAYTTQSKTANFTATAGVFYLVDTTSGTVTATLPAANVAGQQVAVKLNAGANPVTVVPAGTDTIGAAATTASITLNAEVWGFVSSGTGQWNLVAGNKSLASLDARYPLASSLGTAATKNTGTGTGTVLSPDTVTAKGDLIVGTANATVARVGAGTNGYRLTADSTQAAGVAWTAPDPPSGLPLISGIYIAPGGTRSTLAMTQSVEYAVPVYLAQAGTIVRLGVEVTAAGAASTVVRLGIRADSGHLPGSVLGEVTVAGDAISASGVEGTVSITIPSAGIYWFTATSQGGSATVRSCTGPTGFASGASSLATAVGATPNGGYLTAATVTGSLPGTYTVSNRSGGLPLVVARI